MQKWKNSYEKCFIAICDLKQIEKGSDKMQDFIKLEKELGYEFKNKALLKTALTHTSYAYENKKQSNEKLEFLGDSILEFVSSEYIYHKLFIINIQI